MEKKCKYNCFCNKELCDFMVGCREGKYLIIVISNFIIVWYLIKFFEYKWLCIVIFFLKI